MSENVFTTASEASSSGDEWRAADYVGRLVAFYGGRDEGEIPTSFGDSRAAKVELLVVLDGPDGPEAFTDVLIFQTALRRSVTGGDAVLGVLVKGEAKPGKSAPYVLSDADEPQAKAANSWHAKNVSRVDGRWILLGDEAPF